MNKKLFLFLAAAIAFTSVFAGCQSPADSQSGSLSSTACSFIDDTIAGASFDRQDGLPPLNDTLKEAYKKAAERSKMMTYMEFSMDDAAFVTIGDVEDYVRVTDSRFPSVAALKSYLSESFTDECITRNWLSGDSQLFRDYNGALYVLPYGASGDLLYRGHTFTVTKADSNAVEFTATVYDIRDSENSDSSLFFSPPSDPQNYDTATLQFSLVKGSDGVWRFDEFPFQILMTSEN